MPSDTRQEELQGGISRAQDVSDKSSGHRKRSRDGEDPSDLSTSTSSPDLIPKKPRAGIQEVNRSEEDSRTDLSQESKEASKDSVPTTMPTAMPSATPTTCHAESTTSIPVAVPTPALANMQEPVLPVVSEENAQQQDSALATEPRDISSLPTNLVAPGIVTPVASDNVSDSRDQLSPPSEATVPADATVNSKKADEERTKRPAPEAEQNKNTKQGKDTEQSTEVEQTKNLKPSVAVKSASTCNDEASPNTANDTDGKEDVKGEQNAKGEQDTSALTNTITAKDTHSPESIPSKSGTSLGFGAFAARSTPFQTATANAKESLSHTPSAPSDWAQTDGEPATTDAEDIVVRKKSVRKPDTDLPTGEEEEQTMAMIRAKLFAMSSDHTWKERGTGLLKINTRSSKATSRPAARLVMRSDAVLKVILNVQIFAGMQCHIEQERFLRFVAMEEEGLVHFAVKFANANDAHTFMEQLQDHIPAASSSDQS